MITREARRVKKASQYDAMSDKKPSETSVNDTSTEAPESDFTIASKFRNLCDDCLLKQIVTERCESCGSCKFCASVMKSYVKSAENPQTSSASKSNSYEHMKKIIEHQNDVIAKIQNEIQLLVKRNAPDAAVLRLTSDLENAKSKLRRMVQLVIVEQRERKDETWKPIPISLIDDL